MPDLGQLSMLNIVGNLVFSSIGFVAFIYGKKQNFWKIMFCGLALMIFPYFVGNTAAMFAVGTVGTALLFFLRD